MKDVVKTVFLILGSMAVGYAYRKYETDKHAVKKDISGTVIVARKTPSDPTPEIFLELNCELDTFIEKDEVVFEVKKIFAEI